MTTPANPSSSTQPPPSVPAAGGSSQSDAALPKESSESDSHGRGESKDLPGQKSHDAGLKNSQATPEEFQKNLGAEQDKRRDDDLGSIRTLLRIAEQFRKDAGARVGVGEISGGRVDGGIGSTNNTHISISLGHPDLGDTPRSGIRSELQEGEVVWPISAFSACADNVDDAAFLVSAAVLEGLSVGTVRLAATQLAKRLDGEIRLPDDAPRPVPRIRSIVGLFEKFHIRLSVEVDENAPLGERVRFLNHTEAAEIIVHSWTKLSGFPNWTAHLTAWLRDLGLDDSQEVRAAAGGAAGILWSSGITQIEHGTINHWYSDESTWPLDALDGCYATAALANPKLRERINSQLWAWGNITYGIDDVYALRHLSTRRYRQVDSQACFSGLEALLGRNNLLGLIHAQDAYEWLFVAGIEEPGCAQEVTDSLLRVVGKAASEKDETLRLQAIVVALSLVEAERSKKGQRFFVIDRVLPRAADLTGLANVANTMIASSPIQPAAINALRQLYMRGATSCLSFNWTESCILRLFARMYEVGNVEDRERLAYYLQDWSEAAAEKSPIAGVVTDGLLSQVHQGVF